MALHLQSFIHNLILMAKKRISEEQAKKIVQEVANGAKPADLAKKYGFSLGTYYNWRAKFGGKKPKATKKVKTAKTAKKAAPKKRGRKAAPKPAAAPSKATSTKRRRKATSKKRGRRPSRKPATVRTASTGAGAIKSKIVALQGRIKAAEAEIAKLKVAYADAIFG